MDAPTKAGHAHRRSVSIRDPESGSEDIKAALLHHTDDCDLPDPDDYHRISLHSIEGDPLDPLPRPYYTPKPAPSSWFSLLPLRMWKRRRSDALDWQASAGASLTSWHEKSTSAPPLDSYFLHYFRRYLIFLLPSFTQAHYFPTEGDLRPRRTHSTGYLDGLRGLAALSVFFFHTTNTVYDQVKYSYGAPVTEADASKGYGPNLHVLQLPIVRVLYAGPLAVSIFFIVSGFALSIKPVKLMRSRDESGLLTTLQSAVFRRPLRLFLPCFVSTFIVFVLVRMGIYESTRFISEDPKILTGRWKPHIHRMDTFGQQFYDWFWTAIGMIKFFGWSRERFQGFYSEYDTHLWTIPIELRASLALFLTHLTLCRFRSGVRIGITMFFCFVAVNWDRWEMLLFFGGFVLADLNQGVLNPKTIFAEPGRHRLYRTLLILNFISGLYLASYPDESGETTPGFMFLTSIIPHRYSQKSRFWQGIGGLQIVLSVSALPSLSRFFASAIPHYLGQISYALYLVHSLVNHTLSYWLFYAAYLATGGWSTGNGKKIGFTIVLVLDTVIAIWIADIFWRFGDRPMVSFAKWVEGLCLYQKP